MNKKVFTFLGCCTLAVAGAGVGWWLQGESLVTARPATVERISRAELAPAKVQESSAKPWLSLRRRPCRDHWSVPK